jgi:hypothetical protein
VERVKRRSGSFRIVMPAHSAALVTVRQGPPPGAPATP